MDLHPTSIRQFPQLDTTFDVSTVRYPLYVKYLHRNKLEINCNPETFYLGLSVSLPLPRMNCANLLLHGYNYKYKPLDHIR